MLYRNIELGIDFPYSYVSLTLKLPTTSAGLLFAAPGYRFVWKEHLVLLYVIVNQGCWFQIASNWLKQIGTCVIR